MVKINDKITELKEVMQQYKFYDLKVSQCDCVGNLMNGIINLKEKQKYVYLDIGTCGKYLIDSDNNVWNIKAYGQRGAYENPIETVIINLKKQIDFMHNQLYPNNK